MNNGEISSINIAQHALPDFEDYTDEIKDLWSGQRLSNVGAKHIKLQRELEKYLKIPCMELFSSGHSALEVILAAMDLKGEVITTPFTFISTTHAIVRSGLTPVFCDINEDDYTIDVNGIEALITDKTSAIIPVHIYGHVCNVDEIQAIADRYNLKVIYDAAHAFGVEYNGKGIAEYGDASMFSFHATKVFHTIEGGGVAIRDKTLKAKMTSIRNFGITGEESVGYIGFNAKMNEFQAAMGICNLKLTDTWIEQRKVLFEQYCIHLESINGIRIVKQTKERKSNYAYMPILFEKGENERNRIHEKLKTENIFSRKYFYPLTNHAECYEEDFGTCDFPVADYISKRILTLPLYNDLKIKEIDRICSIISREVQ